MPDISRKPLEPLITQPSNLGVKADSQPYLPDLITSGSERREKGVGLLYVDDYNANLQNQYNNAYNYWLWQKQMEYNSPAKQVERLKAAGLNPNFNSIEGTGNVNSIPASDAKLPGRVSQNALSAVGNAVSIATGIASLVSKGVGAFKTIATTPIAVKQYRSLLNALLDEKVGTEHYKSLNGQLKYMKDSILTGLQYDELNSNPRVMQSLWYRGNVAKTFQSEFQQDILQKQKQLMDLKGELMSFDLHNLKPKEESILKARVPQIAAQINYLLEGTGLRIKENKWKNWKEGVGLLSDFLDALIPF